MQCAGMIDGVPVMDQYQFDKVLGGDPGLGAEKPGEAVDVLVDGVEHLPCSSYVPRRILSDTCDGDDSEESTSAEEQSRRPPLRCGLGTVDDATARRCVSDGLACGDQQVGARSTTRVIGTTDSVVVNGEPIAVGHVMIEAAVSGVREGGP